jgi:hypothetical protein
MPAPSVIIHERVANWSRQLRPRFRGWPIRWSETRSAASLVRAAAGSACPILVVDLDRQPVRGLRDLDEALQVAPNALTLVLDPLDREEVAQVARELGATLVLTGPVVPPEVERLLHRWLPIARARSEAEGWSASTEPEPEAWEDPELFQWPGRANPVVAESDRPENTNPVASTKDPV